MKYTIEQFQIVRSRAKLIRLSAPAIFWQSKAESLATICNGVGPDDWPEAARAALDFVFRNYPVSIAVHDVRYEFSDGFDESRRVADMEFGNNLKKEWRFRYGTLRWVNPAALLGRLKIRAAYFAVAKFGAAAWVAARKRKLQTQGGAHEC